MPATRPCIVILFCLFVSMHRVPRPIALMPAWSSIVFPVHSAFVSFGLLFHLCFGHLPLFHALLYICPSLKLILLRPACSDRESRSQIISEHLIPHIIRCHFFSSRLGNHEGPAERDDRSWRQRPTRRSTLPARGRGRRAKRRRPRRTPRLQSNQRRRLRASVHRRPPVLALELMLPREMELARDHRLLKFRRCRTPRVKRLSTIVRSTSLSSRAANGSTLRR